MPIYLDCEFNSTKNKYVNTVCAVFVNTDKKELKKFWSYNLSEVREEIKEYVLQNKHSVFKAWGVTAESRFLLSCGVDPVQLKWVDLFVEYRQITNHNDRMMYGKHLVNGRVVNTVRPKPKWELTSEEKQTAFKPKHSLVEATYKLTDVIRDEAHKDLMRDIIISNDPEQIELFRKDIIKYCHEDTAHLEAIDEAIEAEYKFLLTSAQRKTLLSEQLYRGRYMAITAIMESCGYPVDVDKVKSFARNVPCILFECQKDINSQFPEGKPFKFDVKNSKFTWDQTLTKQWVWDNCNHNTWEKTDGLKKALKEANLPRSKWKQLDRPWKYLSLSLEAFTAQFSYSHSYPRDNFGAQMVRYLKLKQSLNGFTPKQTKDDGSDGESKKFIDFIGPEDGMVRGWFNPYGSQTSRSQPPSSSFLFLKPAWQRSLCMPPKGWAMTGFDYGSEEYLISALNFMDLNMINAYKSGDVYLAYGKDIGEIPKDATKQSHKKERDLYKPVVLSMSYLMTQYGLSAKLTESTGHEYTEEKAQGYIDSFYKAYNKLAEGQNGLKETYYNDKEPLKLPDGWYLFNDKPQHDFRSIVNFPSQGMGAVIMRKAVSLGYDNGIMDLENNRCINLTLHDALYMIHRSDDLEAIDILHRVMKEAFTYFYKGDAKKHAEAIRLDGFTWSHDFEKDSEIVTPGGLKIEASNEYLDSRAEEEFELYKKYFENTEDVGL